MWSEVEQMSMPMQRDRGLRYVETERGPHIPVLSIIFFFFGFFPQEDSVLESG